MQLCEVQRHGSFDCVRLVKPSSKAAKQSLCNYSFSPFSRKWEIQIFQTHSHRNKYSFCELVLGVPLVARYEKVLPMNEIEIGLFLSPSVWYIAYSPVRYSRLSKFDLPPFLSLSNSEAGGPVGF